MNNSIACNLENKNIRIFVYGMLILITEGTCLVILVIDKATNKKRFSLKQIFKKIICCMFFIPKISYQDT